MAAWQEGPGLQEPEETKPVDEKGKTIRIEPGDSQPPVSVRITNSRRERPTENLKPIRFSPDPELREPGNTPNGVETPTKSEKAVDEKRDETKKSLSSFKMAAAITINIAAGAGIVGYAFAPEKYKELYEDVRDGMTNIQDKVRSALTPKPSEEKSVSNAAPSNSALNNKAEKPLEVSAIPTTKEEFFAMIKSGKINISPETFANAQAVEGGKDKPQQKNMKAVMLVESNKKNGERKIEWKKVDAQTADNKEGKNVVIAVKVVDPDDTKELTFLNFKPLADHIVENDSGTHIYLVGGSNDANRQRRGAAIMLIKNGSMIANTDFALPYHPEK